MKQGSWRVVAAVQVACMVAMAVSCAAVGGCGTPIETAAGGTVPMKCAWTFVADTFVAIAGVIAGVLTFASSEKQSRRVAAATVLVIAATAALIASPAGIGICANAEMHCHITAYVLWVLCAVSGIIALVQLAKADPAEAAKPKMKL